MTRLNFELELPDSLAKQAKEAGLLEPGAITRLLREAMRQRALERFLSVADRTAKAGIPEMSPEEVEAEIQAYRTERRRAAGT
ncbi:MAG: hypothetical protein A2140_06780 [Candidatus Muproteobacteria bacterium RBG_16_62_13]|uniref:CopG family transcriptional regulator n=1 Tax=Candidatus Muproteobacteria bacterium RBG_16_62_13 TaxID=1817756 RepID=A0A1F6T3B7_9PROT|nr:MAG: hypothetical protein A2140_06780 [Candidatus Muproteobacteria bacterium RBG_16_62_13]